MISSKAEFLRGGSNSSRAQCDIILTLELEDCWVPTFPAVAAMLGGMAERTTSWGDGSHHVILKAPQPRLGRT